jgi:hypothetical protein
MYTGTDLASFWNDAATEIRTHAVIAAHPPGGTNAFALTIIFVVQPLVGGALIALTSALYLGRRASLRRAYRTALERALPLALIAAILLVGSLALVVVVAVVVTIGVLSASGLASLDGLWRWLALAVASVLIVAGTLAFLLTAAALWLAFSFASIVCVVEAANPPRAIVLTVRRLFAKTRVRRTLLFSAANLAIFLGCYALASAPVVALPFIQSGVAANVLQTLAGSAAALLGTAFGCIFYYDVRVREEGYDLQVLARDFAARIGYGCE